MVYKSPATKKLFDLCIGDGSHGQSAIKTCPAAIFVRRQVQDQIVRTESAFSNWAIVLSPFVLILACEGV